MPGLDILLEHALYHLDLLAWVKVSRVRTTPLINGLLTRTRSSVCESELG